MVFRAILIIINTLLLVLSFQRMNLRITTLTLLLILILQIYLLVLKERKDHNRVISYLESVIEDRSNISPVKKNSFNYQVKRSIDEIISKFNLSKIENQERTDLLNAILDHINIGLITFNKKGEVDLLNKSARKLLKVSYLTNIKDSKLLPMEESYSLLDFSLCLKNNIRLKDSRELYMESSNLTLMREDIRIISLQNLDRAMDKKEVDSWNILIRSLNHELMNSITPISSLASSALYLLDDSSDRDLIDAVETIERRSNNLLKFVNNYKVLSQLPEPDKNLIDVKGFIKNIIVLMSSFAKESGVSVWEDLISEDIRLYGDITQLEQVLINLIKNSIEAKASKVILKSYIDFNGNTVIAVTDDGEGFSKESESKGFIPFYTTKSQGSGLGLSIVRQILHMHNGMVNLETDKNGSTISLIFS